LVREDVTAALVRAASGELGPDRLLDDLVPLVYDELRAMARRQLARESDQLTLDTTALVHEAYLKLVDQTHAPWESRRYFFGAAARAMRQVLVDLARRRRSLKRGSGQRPVSFDREQLATSDFSLEELAVHILDLDEALGRLEAELPRPARVVECRYFAGLSVEETAMTLNVSERTVKGDWALARAWLRRTLTQPASFPAS
jgi:RNA polymerase sigma factor (TIGR02999 family)